MNKTTGEQNKKRKDLRKTKYTHAHSLLINFKRRLQKKN